jgi:hypothetical protein
VVRFHNPQWGAITPGTPIRARDDATHICPVAKCAPIFSQTPGFGGAAAGTDPRSGKKHTADTLFYRNFTKMI